MAAIPGKAVIGPFGNCASGRQLELIYLELKLVSMEYRAVWTLLQDI